MLNLIINHDTTIVLSITTPLTQKDIVTVSYNHGKVGSADGGLLDSFNAFDVYNWASN
ncbi:MAG: hypothetical protein ACYC49_18100 [Ignavibacteriaceae bacterium]